ncbi:hypothetical protein AZE42_01823 [Rhizopogon vesiculosus]|uniref:Uncharacterized protein n=1 Tax=Rhizopogon vesiculosus TaxID=180088 RepID=A0A1J8QL70_9AGAM|nr:hypothetical protein AZE42_01823 [Rhizopogon vesiculosus]
MLPTVNSFLCTEINHTNREPLAYKVVAAPLTVKLEALLHFRPPSSSDDIYQKFDLSSSDNLGTEATLILTFGKFSDTQPREVLPTVWRVKKFPAEGSRTMEVNYASQQAFIKSMVENDKIVGTEASIAIDTKQETNLMNEGGAFFTDPTVADFSGAIFVRNGTEFGFMNLENQPVPSWYLTEILDGSVWGFVFRSTLYAYIASGYEEMDIVKGDIQGQLIWQQNLADIDESTTWTLTQDPVTDRGAGY